MSSTKEYLNKKKIKIKTIISVNQKKINKNKNAIN